MKLRVLDAANESRRHLADIYRMDLEDDAFVALPVEQPWARHVYHLYVVRCGERDALSEYLRSRGVGSLVHYPTPIHLQEAYQHARLQERRIPSIGEGR